MSYQTFDDQFISQKQPIKQQENEEKKILTNLLAYFDVRNSESTKRNMSIQNRITYDKQTMLDSNNKQQSITQPQYITSSSNKPIETLITQNKTQTLPTPNQVKSSLQIRAESSRLYEYRVVSRSKPYLSNLQFYIKFFKVVKNVSIYTIVISSVGMAIAVPSILLFGSVIGPLGVVTTVFQFSVIAKNVSEVALKDLKQGLPPSITLIKAILNGTIQYFAFQAVGSVLQSVGGAFKTTEEFLNYIGGKDIYSSFFTILSDISYSTFSQIYLSRKITNSLVAKIDENTDRYTIHPGKSQFIYIINEKNIGSKITFSSTMNIMSPTDRQIDSIAYRLALQEFEREEQLQEFEEMSQYLSDKKSLNRIKLSNLPIGIKSRLGLLLYSVGYDIMALLKMPRVYTKQKWRSIDRFITNWNEWFVILGQTVVAAQVNRAHINLYNNMVKQGIYDESSNFTDFMKSLEQNMLANILITGQTICKDFIMPIVFKRVYTNLLRTTLSTIKSGYYKLIGKYPTIGKKINNAYSQIISYKIGWILSWIVSETITNSYDIVRLSGSPNNIISPYLFKRYGETLAYTISNKPSLDSIYVHTSEELSDFMDMAIEDGAKFYQWGKVYMNSSDIESLTKMGRYNIMGSSITPDQHADMIYDPYNKYGDEISEAEENETTNLPEPPIEEVNPNFTPTSNIALLTIFDAPNIMERYIQPYNDAKQKVSVFGDEKNKLERDLVEKEEQMKTITNEMKTNLMNNLITGEWKKIPDLLPEGQFKEGYKNSMKQLLSSKPSPDDIVPPHDILLLITQLSNLETRYGLDQRIWNLRGSLYDLLKTTESNPITAKDVITIFTPNIYHPVSYRYFERLTTSPPNIPINSDSPKLLLDTIANLCESLRIIERNEDELKDNIQRMKKEIGILQSKMDYNEETITTIINEIHKEIDEIGFTENINEFPSYSTYHDLGTFFSESNNGTTELLSKLNLSNLDNDMIQTFKTSDIGLLTINNSREWLVRKYYDTVEKDIRKDQMDDAIIVHSQQMDKIEKEIVNRVNDKRLTRVVLGGNQMTKVDNIESIETERSNLIRYLQGLREAKTYYTLKDIKSNEDSIIINQSEERTAASKIYFGLRSNNYTTVLSDIFNPQSSPLDKNNQINYYWDFSFNSENGTVQYPLSAKQFLLGNIFHLTPLF